MLECSQTAANDSLCALTIEQKTQEEISMHSVSEVGHVSKGSLWTGRVISALVVLFMLFDGITKAIKEPHVMAATQQLGFSPAAIVGIGITALVCTAFYVIPATNILGAILLTGYLGGAIATNVHSGTVVFNIVFPAIFGALAWAGIYLRDKRLQELIPFRT
jgi:DoxX-like family